MNNDNELFFIIGYNIYMPIPGEFKQQATLLKRASINRNIEKLLVSPIGIFGITSVILFGTILFERREQITNYIVLLLKNINP